MPEHPTLWLDPSTTPSAIGAALDTETSGLDSTRDHVIEIGIQLFRFEPSGGKVTEPLDSYTELEDPGFPIPMEIQKVTGISSSMVSGHRIDWEKVDSLLERADVILAHNAAFDRGFVDSRSRISPRKVWTCTSSGVDWRAKGFKNAKLQGLCGALAIEYQAHRAMSDVSAMLKLIALEDVFTGKPYLAELLEFTRSEQSWLWLEGETFEHREMLKAHGFRWNGATKTWGKPIAASAAEMQREFVQALFPKAVVRSRPLPMNDRFKAVV